MCSNRTSILHIDKALIPLLGIDAKNKKLAMRNLNAQDISISNVVTINFDSVIYPCRLNTWICSRTTVDDEDDVADLKVL
jgi:hypothetical protein